MFVCGTIEDNSLSVFNIIRTSKLKIKFDAACVGAYLSMHVIWSAVAQCMVECLTRGRGAAGSSLTGVTALQDTLILAKYWLNPGRPVPL